MSSATEHAAGRKRRIVAGWAGRAMVVLVLALLGWTVWVRTRLSGMTTGRRTSTEALESLGGPEWAPGQLSLYLRLPGWPAAYKENAVHLLGLCGRPALPIVVRSLGARDSSVATQAALVLRRFGPEARDAVPALVRALEDQDPDLRSTAALALGSIGPEATAALPALERLLANVNPGVRYSACLGIGGVGTPADVATTLLLQATRERHDAVRAGAAEGLGLVGTADPRVVPALTALLSDRDPGVRIAAANGLGRVGPAAAPAIAQLAAALDDKAWGVQEAAARALGDVRCPLPPAVVVHLGQPVLWAFEQRVAWAAACSLGKLGPQAKAALPDLHAAIHCNERAESLREYIDTLIRQMGIRPGDAVAEIARLLSANSVEVRRSATWYLSYFFVPREDLLSVMPAIIKALDDEDSVVREASAWALETIGPSAREAVPSLRKLLADEDEKVRKAATEALKKIEAAPKDNKSPDKPQSQPED